MGPRLDRIRRRIVDRGILAIAILRIIPLAPFGIINLAAGAIGVPLQQFVLGTILGMAPGLLVMSLLGHQVVQIVSQPTVLGVASLVLAVVLWIAVSIAVQLLVSRYQGRGS